VTSFIGGFPYKPILYRPISDPRPGALLDPRGTLSSRPIRLSAQGDQEPECSPRFRQLGMHAITPIIETRGAPPSDPFHTPSTPPANGESDMLQPRHCHHSSQRDSQPGSLTARPPSGRLRLFGDKDLRADRQGQAILRRWLTCPISTSPKLGARSLPALRVGFKAGWPRGLTPFRAITLAVSRQRWRDRPQLVPFHRRVRRNRRRAKPADMAPPGLPPKVDLRRARGDRALRPA
jgi:hypothetical protein